MSTASKHKPKPPERPPLPRGGLLLGGMSFKKLEKGDEEEEEDLMITDKYSNQLHQQHTAPSLAAARVGQGNSEPHSSLISASTILKAGSTPKEDETTSLPPKKGNKTMHEYKELLSGLKGRIQEKITKTIEDFSSDSSPADKESLLSGSPGKKLEATPTESNKKHHSKTSVIKLQKSRTDPLIRPTNISTRTRARSEDKEDPTDDTLPQPLQLSLITDKVSGEENILIVDEHVKQESPKKLDTETTIRCRSKPTLQKDCPKTFLPNSTSSVTGTLHSEKENAQQNIHEKSDQKCRVSAQDDGHSSLQKSKSWWYFVSLGGRLSQRQQVVLLMISLCVCSLFPIPSYMSGLIMGCMLTSLTLTLYSYIMRPARVKEPPALIPLEDLPPMEIPEMKEAILLDGIYKGWMNEISCYSPDEYHINDTFSVFTTLEGTKLKLQRPKIPISRRAMHDESLTSSQFILERNFELKGGRVSLIPPGLVRKRMWSKKYPICIALAEPGTTSVDLVHSDGSSHESRCNLSHEEKYDTSVLFLFARTGREKEEWFHRFHAATQEKPLANAILEMRRAIERHRQSYHRRVGSEGLLLQRHNSTDSQSSTASDSAESIATEMETMDPVLEFTRYMGHLMPAATFTRLLSPSKNNKEAGATPRMPFTGSIICDSQLHWLNALIGRCFFDFLRDSWWADKVKDKLQRKLSKIHVPYFIEELQVTAIDLGKEMPVIRRAANPYLDEQGFWVELDVSYSGGFTMTIETKVNLMKLKRNNPEQSQSAAEEKSDRSPVTDPDEEDSAESSTDEEVEETGPEEKESGGGSKKLLKYLDKLTSSKYFQQATEYKYIKRAMENVSNTPLQLQVSVKNLVGKLAINIPPPPSDRLWYGFRGPPRLWLVAKPQVGERVVTITHITDWIERKLELEFQRVFVMPNMDDLVIPILRSSGEDLTDSLCTSASGSLSTLPLD